MVVALFHLAQADSVLIASVGERISLGSASEVGLWYSEFTPTTCLPSLVPSWLCFPPGSSVVVRDSQCPSDHIASLEGNCFSWLSLAMSPRMVVLGSSWNNSDPMSIQINSEPGFGLAPPRAGAEWER